VVTNPPFKGIAKFLRPSQTIMAKMDALSAKGCIAAFNAMDGVDVHIILSLPKYIRNGELVACEKTAIFVGNIPARIGKRDGFASIFCSEDNEEL
jgi:hypothetical protein